MNKSFVLLICLIFIFEGVNTIGIKQKTMKKETDTEDQFNDAVEDYIDNVVEDETNENFNGDEFSGDENSAAEEGQNDETGRQHSDEYFYDKIYNDESIAKEIIRSACTHTQNQADCSVYICNNNYVAHKTIICKEILAEHARYMELHPEYFDEKDFEDQGVDIDGTEDDGLVEENDIPDASNEELENEERLAEMCNKEAEFRDEAENYHFKPRVYRVCLQRECGNTEGPLSKSPHCVHVRKEYEKRRRCLDSDEGKQQKQGDDEDCDMIRRMSAEEVLQEKCGYEEDYDDCADKLCKGGDFEVAHSWHCERHIETNTDGSKHSNTEDYEEQSDFDQESYDQENASEFGQDNFNEDQSEFDQQENDDQGSYDQEQFDEQENNDQGSNDQEQFDEQENYDQESNDQDNNNVDEYLVEHK